MHVKKETDLPKLLCAYFLCLLEWNAKSTAVEMRSLRCTSDNVAFLSHALEILPYGPGSKDHPPSIPRSTLKVVSISQSYSWHKSDMVDEDVSSARVKGAKILAVLLD